MSNALAIQAVTRTLHFLLTEGMKSENLPGVSVTARPPDRARNNNPGKQLNLFLYQTSLNAAWRNVESPRQNRPPPLALCLHYLITAYGPDDDAAEDHHLLGAAMRTLHDQAVLNRDYIRNILPNNDLADQLEHVRITPQAMPLEEVSKLWTSFQTQYRISVAYEVSVVLIDSHIPTKTPLPVLQRGPDDRGPAIFASSLPTLNELELPNAQPSLRRGQRFAIKGQNLGISDLRLRLEHPKLAQAIEPLIVSRSDDRLEVELTGVGIDANDLSLWLPGFQTISALTEPVADHPISSNALALPVSPEIALSTNTATAGDINLTVTCRPRVRPGQQVTLILGPQQVALLPADLSNPADVTQPSSLKFEIKKVKASPQPYTVRLRVDGVDSLPVRVITPVSGPPRLEFDPAQQLTVS
jgi:Pvc16 N-terminal domain